MEKLKCKDISEAELFCLEYSDSVLEALKDKRMTLKLEEQTSYEDAVIGRNSSESDQMLDSVGDLSIQKVVSLVEFVLKVVEFNR